jgi:hypothetical protein
VESGKRRRLAATAAGLVEPSGAAVGTQGPSGLREGYGSGPWLWQLCRHQLRFVVRWKKGNKLIDASGQERKAWEIACGKRPWGEARLLWDTHFRLSRSTRVLALPVRHPQHRGPLWVVVVRQGKGHQPWYLLTNELVESAEQVWDIVLSSVRSLQIEESFRFQKNRTLDRIPSAPGLAGAAQNAALSLGGPLFGTRVDVCSKTLLWVM